MNDFELDNEMKVVAILSGYIKQLKDGKDYEQTTYDIASQIDRLYGGTKEVEEE